MQILSYCSSSKPMKLSDMCKLATSIKVRQRYMDHHMGIADTPSLNDAATTDGRGSGKPIWAGVLLARLNTLPHTHMSWCSSFWIEHSSSSCPSKIWWLAGATVDVHCYDVLTNKWSRLTPLGEPPSPRAAHVATTVGTMVVIQENGL